MTTIILLVLLSREAGVVQTTQIDTIDECEALAGRWSEIHPDNTAFCIRLNPKEVRWDSELNI